MQNAVSSAKRPGPIVTADTADPTVAADLLGHSDSSTTLRHYVTRNRLHPEAAELVNRAVTGDAINGKQTVLILPSARKAFPERASDQDFVGRAGLEPATYRIANDGS